MKIVRRTIRILWGAVFVFVVLVNVLPSSATSFFFKNILHPLSLELGILFLVITTAIVEISCALQRPGKIS
jgi:hypothetical protein